MQLSLVAYYGEKSDGLVRLLSKLQDCLSTMLATAFRPYAITQVHATILGMEAEVKADGIYNKWYTENKGQCLPIDFVNLIPFLEKDLPEIPVRIGGYQQQQDYGFTSRGQHPYLRSFSIQGSIAVAMGWPVQATPNGWRYSHELYQLRQAFERFHLCHKWNTATYRDNDFFFVLGKVDKTAVSPERLEKITAELRQILSQTEAIIYLNLDSLSIVRYEDMELPPASTQSLELKKTTLSETMWKQWYQ